MLRGLIFLVALSAGGIAAWITLGTSGAVTAATNRDGTVEKEEIDDFVLTHRGKDLLVPRLVDEMLRAMDADGDGIVSSDEVVTFVRQHPEWLSTFGAAIEAPPWPL